MVEGACARPSSRVPDSVRLGFFCDANTGAGQDFHRPDCGGSTPPSRSLGLQTLTVKSRLLTGEKCLHTATRCESEATRHFRIRGEIYYHAPLRTESLQVGILPDAPNLSAR